jgi:hypothetical protein
MSRKQRIAKKEREAPERRETATDASPADPRLITIARALGRLIAREQVNTPKPAGER